MSLTTENESLEREASENEPCERPVIHFRVSTKHTELASARARTMFSLPFAESKKDETSGLRKWVFEAVSDAKAFQVVLSIIHGRTEATPEKVFLLLLAEISAVVDDLQCRDAVHFFADLWITELWQVELADTKVSNRFDWILISSIFEEDAVFEYMTDAAIRTLKGPVGDNIPPIAPSIIGKTATAISTAHINEDLGAIEQRREESLHPIHVALCTKLHEFCDMPWVDEGTYMQLGALLHQNDLKGAI